jgi:hypothetical protein
MEIPSLLSLAIQNLVPHSGAVQYICLLISLWQRSAYAVSVRNSAMLRIDESITCVSVDKQKVEDMYCRS